MDPSKDMDSIQQLKNIFSTGNCQIEVKFGTMVFDSPIVIITSNASPRQIALSTGEAAEPLYRTWNTSKSTGKIQNITKTVFCTETGTYLQLFRHEGIWSTIKTGDVIAITVLPL